MLIISINISNYFINPFNLRQASVDTAIRLTGGGSAGRAYNQRFSFNFLDY